MREKFSTNLLVKASCEIPKIRTFFSSYKACETKIGGAIEEKNAESRQNSDKI
jgi:hypothetical protein